MKRTLLPLIAACVLGWILGNSNSATVSAQAGQYGFLHVRAGSPTPSGGIEVIDMRNGKSWFLFTNGKAIPNAAYPFHQVQ
jgi:hypothetical protein